MWPFFAKHIFSKMKKYTVYFWMVNCVSEKFCLWQSTTISMWTNTKCLFVRSNHFYSTFKLSQQSFCLTNVFTPKYSIFFAGSDFLYCFNIQQLIQPLKQSFVGCWFSHFIAKVMLVFFCQNNLPIYQNLFTGWPLWKDKVDTWGNKTCLFNQHKHKKKTQLFTTTSYRKSR